MAKTKLGYVKPRALIEAKITVLAKDILDSTKMTIHQKRDMMAWRNALLWALTEEKKAWQERIEQVKKEQAKKDDENARKAAATRDDAASDRKIPEAE